eukprot:CAMPEP_0201675754 /NCGR_PEP_ID=MMETSP0494-20130426/40266_1 /ASSEMBLY_ACC=CAM_ASM_000839 /TAXON_ID=420259 /ORGANISM="Thalassiosira gravida, Strain GMp14c1" /LENGTH=722 /DNA_ID=CAMNT_0048158285 /DNA_START=161 /DNA_END=2329 /DNA_ORIENTATION=+
MAVDAVSPVRNSLDEHRFVVAGATLDELDQKSETGSSSSHSHSNRDLFSVASTVDVDNVHPYLMKYADAYAHDHSDASSVGTGPTFLNVKPSSHFKAGQKVLYTGSNGSSSSEAIIMKILYDDENQPYYTIKLASGKEKETDSDKLNQNAGAKATKVGATDENGNVPTRCVDFKTNPTPLFETLYQSNWKDAHQRLASHPEEANIWVARYAKKSNTPGSSVRWQLLPIHLFIALGGSSNTDETKGEEDVPADEKDEMQIMEEETKVGKTPPLEILAALLAVYPRATQCTDDQDMIPLHSAIRGNSSLSVIDKLLEVDPFSVYRKDIRGRNAFNLVERVYGKRIHKVPVGQEDKARERKYAKLMNILSDAARHVSSPPRSLPKEKAAPHHLQQKKQGGEVSQTLLQQLQSENSALRRENAMLHDRAETNDRLLRQLVEKLQVYEDQRSIDMEFMSERRDEILLSISEGDDNKIDAEKDDAEEGTGEESVEDKAVGGEGAYHKRLERYLHSTPSKNTGDISIISPASTVTEASESIVHSPTSVLIPKLCSCGDENDNPNSIAHTEGNKGKISNRNGDETKRDGTASITSSEHHESGDANAEGQAMSGSRHATAQDENPVKNEVSIEPIQLDALNFEAVADKADITTSQTGSPTDESEPEVAKETAVPENVAVREATNTMESDSNTSVKRSQNTTAAGGNGECLAGRPDIAPVLSLEEENQLRVE